MRRTTILAALAAFFAIAVPLILIAGPPAISIWQAQSGDGAPGQLLKSNGTGNPVAWTNSAGGTVTTVSSANDSITIATPSSTPSLAFVGLHVQQDGTAVGDIRTVNYSNGLLAGASGNVSPNYGTGVNTICRGNDSRLSDSRAPNGVALGALTGSYPAPGLSATAAVITLAGKNGLTVNGADTTPSAGTVTVTPTYGNSANTVCQGNDSRLSDSRAPNGVASGDLSGSFPSPTVAKVNGQLVNSASATNNQIWLYNLNANQWNPTATPTLGGLTVTGNVSTTTKVQSDQLDSYTANTSITALQSVVLSAGKAMAADVLYPATAGNTITSQGNVLVNSTGGPKNLTVTGAIETPTINGVTGGPLTLDTSLLSQNINFNTGTAFAVFNASNGSSGTAIYMAGGLPYGRGGRIYESPTNSRGMRFTEEAGANPDISAFQFETLNSFNSDSITASFQVSPHSDVTYITARSSTNTLKIQTGNGNNVLQLLQANDEADILDGTGNAQIKLLGTTGNVSDSGTLYTNTLASYTNGTTVTCNDNLGVPSGKNISVGPNAVVLTNDTRVPPAPTNGTTKIIYDNNGAYAETGTGTAGQVLTVSGGIPTWAAASSSSGSGASGTYTTLEARSIGSSQTVNVTVTDMVVKTLAGTTTTVSGTFSVNFATTGLDGLDTGSLLNNTWYYVYAIWNGTALHGVGSANSTLAGVTLPSGYTYLAMATSCREATNLILSFSRWNHTVMLGPVNTATTRVLNLGTATVNTDIDCSALIPPTARLGLFLCSVADSTAGVNDQLILVDKLTGNDLTYVGYRTPASGTAYLTANAEAPVTATGILQYRTMVSTCSNIIWVQGYRE